MESDLECLSNIHEKKTKHFPFHLDKTTIKIDVFLPDMMEIKPKKYKPTEKLNRNQTKKIKIFHTL